LIFHFVRARVHTAASFAGVGFDWIEISFFCFVHLFFLFFLYFFIVARFVVDMKINEMKKQNSTLEHQQQTNQHLSQISNFDFDLQQINIKIDHEHRGKTTLYYKYIFYEQIKIYLRTDNVKTKQETNKFKFKI
jgi:hypothetical protein